MLEDFIYIYMCVCCSEYMCTSVYQTSFLLYCATLCDSFIHPSRLWGSMAGPPKSLCRSRHVHKVSEYDIISRIIHVSLCFLLKNCSFGLRRVLPDIEVFWSVVLHIVNHSFTPSVYMSNYLCSDFWWFELFG